jgi:hypothetical protein
MRFLIAVLASVLVIVLIFVSLVLFGYVQLETTATPWVLFSISFTTTIALGIRSLRREGSLKKEYTAIEKAIEKDKLETEITELDSEKTEKETKVHELENRLRSVEEERQALVKYIRNDLHKEAKEVAENTMLSERASRQEEQLLELFEEWKETKDRLSNYTSTVNPKIRNIIESELKPRHELQKNIDNVKSFLLVIATLFGVISFLWPEIPVLFVLLILGIPAIAALGFMLHNYIKLNPTLKTGFRKNVPLYGAIPLLMIGLTGFFFELILVFGQRPHYYYSMDLFSMMMLFVFGFTALLSALFIVRKWIQSKRSARSRTF